MTDWPSRIVEMVRVKQRIHELDVDEFFPMTLASEAATTAELDAGHRSFLAAANGCRAHLETQDLLGLDQLRGGPHRDAFTAWIDSAPPQALAAGYSSETLLPIAVDLELPFFAAMPVVDGRVQGRVLTLDPSGIIDDHGSFEEYYDATLAYARRVLADFESGAYRL